MLLQDIVPLGGKITCVLLLEQSILHLVLVRTFLPLAPLAHEKCGGDHPRKSPPQHLSHKLIFSLLEHPVLGAAHCHGALQKLDIGAPHEYHDFVIAHAPMLVVHMFRTRTIRST